MSINKILLISLILCAGVFAALPNCNTPTYDASNGWWNYIDGLNNSYNPAASTSYEVTSGMVTATEKALLGAEGLTFITGVKYHESDDDRGGGWLFYDASNLHYYAVFQWNGGVWGIQGLTKQTDAGGEWYETYSGGDSVFVSSDNNELSIWTYEKIECTAGSVPFIHYYKFGNATAYQNFFEFGGAWSAENSVTTEGSFSNRPGVVPGTCQPGGDNIFYGGNITRDATPPTNEHHLGSIDNNEELLFLQSSYGCGTTEGNVTFYAYEGSATCSAFGALPSIDCTINGDSYTIEASTSSEVNTTATVPSFKDADEFASGYWAIDLHKGIYNDRESADIIMFKEEEHTSQLTIRPTNPVEAGSWWEYLFGDNNDDVLRDTNIAGVLRYNPPTGTVNNIPLTSVFLNTTFETAGVYCREGIFGFYADNYTMDFVVGINNTHFKRTRYNCLDGTASTTATYNTSVYTLLDDVGDNYAGQLETTINDFGSIWLDTETNSVNRFFYFRLDFEPGTRYMYGGDMLVGDNENFVMNYTYTNQTIEAITSDAYSYGTYYYSCEVPTGYYSLTNSSGYLDIDEPMESVSVILQAVKVLNLDLSILNQLAPAVNAICTANISSGAAVVSGSDGVCSFTNLAPSTVLDIDVNHFDLARSATFSIGDYYNSEGYGNSQTCASFDGTYTYTWDIANEYATFVVTAISKEAGALIYPANVYWDGELMGVTGSEGRLSFETDLEFNDHNLTLTHNQFSTKSVTVRLGDSPYTIEMVGTGAYDAEVDASKPVGREEFLTIFSSPLFMAVLVIIAVGGVGMSMGGLAGGAFMSAISSALLHLTGMLPLSWVIIIVFLSIVVGFSGSAGGLKRILGGGK